MVEVESSLLGPQVSSIKRKGFGVTIIYLFVF